MIKDRDLVLVLGCVPGAKRGMDRGGGGGGGAEVQTMCLLYSMQCELNSMGDRHRQHDC